MKLRVREKQGRTPVNTSSVILGGYLFALLLYALLMRFAAIPDSIAAVESLRPSPYGFGVGAYYLGYVSLLVIVTLALLSVWQRKGKAWFSVTGAAAILALGIVLGSSFAVASVSVPSQSPLQSVQDSEHGFTLNVYYNSTTVTLGRNLTMRYTLTDDSYTLSTPYYLFGGQFSMVFYDSAGNQTVAFRAPITFSRQANQYTVLLQPGETWSTLLQWDGLIIPLNGSSYMAAPGAYSLQSYAVLQDANASLYVVLHPTSIPISVVSG